MDKTWVVCVAGRTEPFREMDTAVEYMKAELRAGKEVAWIESRDMTEEEYLRLTETP